jgi:hypothetical protein
MRGVQRKFLRHFGRLEGHEFNQNYPLEANALANQ